MEQLSLRFCALGLAALCAATCLRAQEFRFGGGYNMSNVQESGPEHWTGRPGYQFGADLQLGDLWFVRGGAHFQVRNLEFITTGLDSAGAADAINREYRYTERSLRVPLMLGRNLIRISDEPAFNAYVMAGPTALFALSTELSDDELEVDARRTQWLIGFGGGVTFGFVFVEGSYGVAMSDIFQGEPLQTNPKVNQFCLNAGVRLALAR
ncbi:MAG: outer membrane beta-barrel protein [Flavobacteriales bacterium]|nr:outer membrane beta-barrel protein [Flavobacteriales bacterium]